MFTEPQEWQWTKDRIAVFHLALGHILNLNDLIGPNTYEQLCAAGLFWKLKDWGIALELGVDTDAPPILDAMRRVADAGGEVPVILAYDHAFHQFSPDQYAQYVNDIRAVYPTTVIGVYAAFPSFSARAIVDRLKAFDRRQVCPDFVRLDVDPNQQNKLTQSEFKILRDACTARRVPLQVVINGRDGIGDQVYVTEAKAWFDRAMMLGSWDAVIVESWASTPPGDSRVVPHNLPESDPNSHTHLLRYVLERWKDAEPFPPSLGTVWLKTTHGTYLSVGSDAFLKAGTTRQAFELPATFTPHVVGLVSKGTYGAVENDTRVKVDRESIGSEWEEYTQGEKDGGLTLKSRRHGKEFGYLSASHDGTVRANAPQAITWEVFTPEPATIGSGYVGRLSLDGRMLRDGAGAYYRAVWSSALAILTRDHEPLLDFVARRGFNGCRVFCGNLEWAGQTPQAALDALPRFLDAAAARGLRVEVTALTGTKGGGYNPRAHIQQVAAICLDHENAILEMANEPWHPSQDGLTPEFLRACMSVVPDEIICALGAAEDDESDQYAGGNYVTAHLDRDRDEWNMVRRVRELENLSSATGKPVFNNEPIKMPSQNSNPSIAFTMAVLNRGFEVQGILHTDDGLQGTAPAPGSVAMACFEAYIRGSRVITTEGHLTFKNAGWGDSPIKEFSGAVRVYSFLGDQNVTVALGITPDLNIQTKNGWSLGPIIDEMPGVKVFELVR
jgi:hypothetical protein